MIGRCRQITASEITVLHLDARKGIFTEVDYVLPVEEFGSSWQVSLHWLHSRRASPAFMTISNFQRKAKIMFFCKL